MKRSALAPTADTAPPSCEPSDRPEAEVVGLEHLGRPAGTDERAQTVPTVENQTNACPLVGESVRAGGRVQRARASWRDPFTHEPARDLQTERLVTNPART